MSIIKNQEDLENLRESGKRLAAVLFEVARQTTAGANAKDLDKLAERLIRKGGDVPAFLNYQPEGADRPFPASICISINDEVVHGIPNEKEKIIKEGDIVTLDLGLSHKGMITDMAVTVPVGEIDEESKKLLEVTKKALENGINSARVGGRIGDIGYAIEGTLHGTNFDVVEELGGHGVGYKVHDEPYIANYGEKGTGPIIKEGMVLALEPIVNVGNKDVVLDDDGYTFRTKDGRRSAQFEHTIYVTKEGVEVITKS